MTARRIGWRTKYLVLKIAAVCSAVLTAGCTLSTGGTGQPARDSAGIIGIGRSIPQVLPTTAQLSTVLKTTVYDDGFPPSVGGPNVLSSWLPDEGKECAGVSYVQLGYDYQEAGVKAVAHKNWSGVKGRFRVEAGVVALGSPRDAAALFAKFVAHWQQCRGKTVTLRRKPGEVGIPDYFETISQVDVAGRLVTAVVMLSSSDRDRSPFPFERAISLAYNCILDVEVRDAERRQGDSLTTTHVADVVKIMLANAGA